MLLVVNHKYANSLVLACVKSSNHGLVSEAAGSEISTVALVS